MYGTGKRGLSQEFLKSLNEGLLSPFLDLVHKDHTLDLEIRNDYINIYYRGGNLVRIKHSRKAFLAYFNNKYFKDGLYENMIEEYDPNPYNPINNEETINEWLKRIPILKHSMDFWLTKHKKDEREFQQVLVRENNYGRIANSTDYYVCDIEYSGSVGRLDIVAIKWPSSGPSRKNPNNLSLVVIEMKYGENALLGKSGIEDHIHKINDHLSDDESITSLKEEMKIVINQKIELGLIPELKHPVESFNDENEYILVLANHDPDSTILASVLNAGTGINNNFIFRIASSNFSGYGLFDEAIYPYEEFSEKYKYNIYSRQQ